MKSAAQNPTVVASYLEEETKNKRMVGPLANLPFKEYQINPIGLVPKKKPNSFRTIVDLSSPPGSSINDLIPDKNAAVKYCSIAEAVELILAKGPNAYLAKTDIKNAFRLIPLHPSHYKQLVVKWDSAFYFDRCLPMGARSACQIFERFSSALAFAASKKGLTIAKYLDDFLIISESKEQGERDLKSFLDLCKEIGVPMAEDKTIGPFQVLEFLGLELDTVQEIICLPLDKLEKCRSLIESLLRKKKCTLRELESVLGLLSFTCQVILPGRAFLKRLYALTIKVAKPYHLVYLSAETKQDLQLWLIFLRSHNGVSLYREQFFLSPGVRHILTDASQSLACGAVFGSEWFAIPWPSAWWSGQNITFLELIPILVALETWGPQLKNTYVMVHTDNLDLTYVLNNQTSKEKLVMPLVRRLVLVLLKHNIMFRCKHIPGFENVLADNLSRLRIDKFKELFPTANPYPTATSPLPVNF